MNSSRRKGGRWCSAPNCKNNSNANRDISFFTFPKDEQRAKKWTVNSRRADLLKKDAKYLNKNCTICGVHFEDIMFLNFLKNRLKPDAVPTLFNVPNPPKPVTLKRKAPKERTSKTRCAAKKAKFDIQVENVNENITDTNTATPTECLRTKVASLLSEVKSSGSLQQNLSENGTIRYSEMDIKEEDLCSEDAALQNETKFFIKNVTMKINSDDDCDKTEIKSENTDLCSQKETECFTRHAIKQVKREISTCNVNIKTQTEEQTLVSYFDSQKQTEDRVIMVKNYNSDDELDNEIEIKEEPLWLDTETSSACDVIKDVDFSPVKSPRLSTEGISSHSSGESLLVPARKHTNGKDSCESRENNVTKISNIEHVRSDQSGECSDGKTDNTTLYLNQTLVCIREAPYTYMICDKSITLLSTLKQHDSIYGVKKPHKCEICDKRYTRLSQLKQHSLIHTGQKPHKCQTCDKAFTHLCNLKQHSLIHNGKKSHKCQLCGKTFTQLSGLKYHSLIHTGQKPHKCQTCDKAFTHLSNLKQHSLIHKGKRSHKCQLCGKTFTQLSGLKYHSSIHTGQRPHKCQTCDKAFTQLSYLKKHNLIHTGQKPHKCETCGKNFAHLSGLKQHSWIHADLKPHKCQLCDKTFPYLSSLKFHSASHEDKSYKCGTCDKSYTRMSDLKKHQSKHAHNYKP